MTGFYPASVAVASGDPASQVLWQFEPDADGTWEADVPGPGHGADATDDPQWVVWADAALESAWAASELATDWLAVVRISAPR